MRILNRMQRRQKMLNFWQMTGKKEGPRNMLTQLITYMAGMMVLNLVSPSKSRISMAVGTQIYNIHPLQSAIKMPKLLLSAAETPTAPLRHPPKLPEPLIIIYAGFHNCPPANIFYPIIRIRGGGWGSKCARGAGRPHRDPNIFQQNLFIQIIVQMEKTLALTLMLLTLAASIKIIPYHNYLNATAYLADLATQQSAFEAGIDTLGQSVNQTTAAANNATTLEDKIKILEAGILQQENSIHITSQELIPSAKLKQEVCQNFTELDRTNLINKCQATILDLQALRQKLNSLPEDSRIIEMKADTDYQIYYLRNVQKVLNTDCITPAEPTEPVKQSNIYAPNWILGDQTVEDLVNSYVARSRESQSLSNCPIETPFFNGIECINCTDPTPLFNMKTLQCTTCPNGSIFDSQAKKCNTSNPTSSNPIAANNILGPDPQPTAQDTVCPAATPYFTGTQCISCPKLYDSYNKICFECPANTIWDPAQDKCVTGTPNISNPVGSGNIVGPSPNPNTTDIPCPQETPYFNVTTCIDCPKLYDPALTACVECPQGYVWLDQNDTCQILTPVAGKPNVTAPVVPGNQTNTTNPDGNQTNTTNPDGNQTNTTNPDGNQTNTTNPDGNQTTGNQTDNSTLDNSTDNQTLTNQTNGTIVSNPDFADMILGPDPQPTANDTVCPPETPFFDGTQCINCHSIFNSYTGGCVICVEPSVWDPTTDRCVDKGVVNYASNLTLNNNWISASPYDSLTNSQQQLAQPNVTACPTQTPFFNGQQCIACDGSTVFNVDTLKCESCPTGTSYDANKHKCVNNNATYITNPQTAPNLILSGTSQGEWNYLYNQEKAANPNLQDCPAATPYYDGTSCITCSAPTQYFDLFHQACAQCNTGSTYSSTQKECLDQSGDPMSPKLEQMASTVFAHHKLVARHRLY